MMYLVVLLLAILLGQQVVSTIIQNTFDWPAAKPNSEKFMSALIYREHGGVDKLEVVDNFPRPVPRDDQILVHVQASALNPVDFKFRRNPVPSMFVSKPKILGLDMAGVVVARGSAVSSRFQVGDRVAAMLPILGSQWGAAAEYVAVREDYAAQIPTTVTFEEAASLPLAGLTAIQKLRQIPEPTRNKKILIQAGAGGVGTLAIQYAKHVQNMYVATTASVSKTEFLSNLGADLVVDYRTQNFTDLCQHYDAVLDPMSYLYEDITLNSNVLKPTGVYLNILSSNWAWKDGKEEANGPSMVTNVIKHKLVNWASNRILPQYHVFPVHPDGRTLQHLLVLVEQGTMQAVIDSTYDLWTQASKAFQRLESGTCSGKVVLRHT